MNCNHFFTQYSSQYTELKNITMIMIGYIVFGILIDKKNQLKTSRSADGRSRLSYVRQLSEITLTSLPLISTKQCMESTFPLKFLGQCFLKNRAVYQKL